MSQPAKKLKRPVEEVRKELLADPDTARIARSVKMPLEEYVELVLHYAQNPDKEPELLVVPDEELKAQGYTPATAEEVGKFFVDAITGKISTPETERARSAFTDERPRAPLPDPAAAPAPAKASEQPKGDPALLEELNQARSRGLKG